MSPRPALGPVLGGEVSVQILGTCSFAPNPERVSPRPHLHGELSEEPSHRFVSSFLLSVLATAASCFTVDLKAGREQVSPELVFYSRARSQIHSARHQTGSFITGLIVTLGLWGEYRAVPFIPLLLLSPSPTFCCHLVRPKPQAEGLV